MASKSTWQRGAADLVSVAAGMLILTIVMAGTAGSMVYGREALIRQEHYKTAAYLLRGQMEWQQAQLMITAATDSRYLGFQTYRPIPIESGVDFGGIHPITVTITRERIEPKIFPELPDIVSYYVLTMHAKWRERDFAENRRTESGQLREISFTTSVVIPATL